MSAGLTEEDTHAEPLSCLNRTGSSPRAEMIRIGIVGIGFMGMKRR